jgi:hypothetical protein
MFWSLCASHAQPAGGWHEDTAMMLRTIFTRLAQWDDLLVNRDGFVPLSLTTFRS